MPFSLYYLAVRQLLLIIWIKMLVMENKLFVAVLVCFFSVAVRAAESPNIVLIVADDMGWKDVGYNGSEIRTPKLVSTTWQNLLRGTV